MVRLARPTKHCACVGPASASAPSQSYPGGVLNRLQAGLVPIPLLNALAVLCRFQGFLDNALLKTLDHLAHSPGQDRDGQGRHLFDLLGQHVYPTGHGLEVDYDGLGVGGSSLR